MDIIHTLKRTLDMSTTDGRPQESDKYASFACSDRIGPGTTLTFIRTHLDDNPSKAYAELQITVLRSFVELFL